MKELQPEQYNEYSSILRSQPAGREISFGVKDRYLASEFQRESNQTLKEMGVDSVNLYHLRALAAQQLPSDSFAFDQLNRAVTMICDEIIQVVRERVVSLEVA